MEQLRREAQPVTASSSIERLRESAQNANSGLFEIINRLRADGPSEGVQAVSKQPQPSILGGLADLEELHKQLHEKIKVILGLL
jgi:hypothetical protein